VTLALASVLAPISAARGQVLARDEGDAQQHAAHCRTAARFLETGTPRPRLPWARSTILDCGAEAPAALAAATRRLSASRDTADLNALLRAAQFVRDAGFFEAALEVAGMPDASPEARATGFLVAAMETTDRIDFDLGELLAADGPILGCVGGRSDHSLRITGGLPLPADASVRLRAALASVGATPGEPLLVRNAANCASAVVGASR
jgi:hypothetical protein